MDYFDSIRIRALASVMDPDHDDVMIDIFEWYSKEFSTPLHVVQHDLPLDDVLGAYFRHIYKAMPPEDRHNHAIWLLETPEERAERAAKDKNEDEEFLRKAAEQNAKKKQPTQAQLAFERMQKKLLEGADQFKSIAPRMFTEKPLRDKPMPEVKLPESKPEDPSEVTITYMSEADFEAELDKPVGPPPGRRKK